MSGLFDFGRLYILFIASSLTVGLGFIVHELAHKIVAQNYGCFAQFRAWDKMLILAIIMSFFGFLFAVPGAVMISGPVGKKRNGIISAAGPASNIILSAIFLVVLLTTNSPLSPFIYLGYYINVILAVFNLIPISIFDGRKILNYNKLLYVVMAVLGIILIGGGMFYKGALLW